MKKSKYESMAHHMKGFIQGLLFIFIIIMIIAFFQVIAYFDRTVTGNTYSDSGAEPEYWNENIELSDGIRSDGKAASKNQSYEDRRKDFGSKSLNQKDKDEAIEKKNESKKKDLNYIKK